MAQRRCWRWSAAAAVGSAGGCGRCARRLAKKRLRRDENGGAKAGANDECSSPPTVMPDYHKLEVWVLACELSDRTDRLAGELGSRIRAHTADQLCRAADAIHENIAEGCGFRSDPQLAKYLRQARGSGDEVQDELETLERRGQILPGFEDLLPKSQLLCKKLARFIDAVDPPAGGRRKRNSRG